MKKTKVDQILEVLKGSSAPMEPQAIIDATGIAPGTVHPTLRRLLDRGEIHMADDHAYKYGPHPDVKPHPVAGRVMGINDATARGDAPPERGAQQFPDGSVVVRVDGKPYLIYVPKFVGAQYIDLDGKEFRDRFLPGKK